MDSEDIVRLLMDHDRTTANDQFGQRRTRCNENLRHRAENRLLVDSGVARDNQLEDA